MKYLNKIATVFCSASLGLLSLTSCEGGDLYSIDAPDWISAKVDSIKNLPSNDPLYSIGNPDFSTGWWSSFSKYYVIPAGEIWELEFDLAINPSATNTYKNFALIICSDAERGAKSYKEYGAIRFDNQPSGNSEWGDYIDRTLVTSNLTFETDTDAGVDKLGGRVKLTVDRSSGGLVVTMTNGTVTKKYENTSELPILNNNPENTNIRCYLCVEGSYIEVWKTNIEPFDENAEYQPVSLDLNGVPAKILLGTTFEEAFANLSATVEFEKGATKNVEAADLTFQVIPDLNSLGTKTLVAAYGKTFKGANSNKPVIATKQFDVVDKMFTCLGATDNSTAFWDAHSDYIKVEPGQTFVYSFTNYTSGANNWNNFVTVLTNKDGSTEYAVLRADNWGWGTGWAGEELASKCTPSGGQSDWGAWLAAMDGAKVTVYIKNNGDGTADVKTEMLGNDGNTYYQDYIGINTVTDPTDFYFHFTVDNCHLEFDNVIGAEDNSTAFWDAHSEPIKVPAGAIYVTRFKNYTSGANNWNNFVTVLTNSDGSTEYAVLRADNWGWGTGWAGEELASKCTPSGGQSDWGAWLAAMDGAMVTVTINNRGNGIADVKCVMVGNDGNTYKQDYIGINTVTSMNDFYFHFTVDNCHLVFE